jgi:hypothetical protein
MACLVLQQVCIKIQALRQLPEERKQEFAVRDSVVTNHCYTSYLQNDRLEG